MSRRKLTQEEFITKAKEVHGDIYDYSKALYVSAITKVVIVCKTHGEYLQSPHKHLRGQGCSKCRYDSLADKYKTTVEEFILKSNEAHGGIYDYSNVDYVNSKTKVVIICPVHQNFEQIPNDHLGGHGCPCCGLESAGASLKSNTESFISKAKEVHGENRYDYSKVKYVNDKTKVIITCIQHGDFEQIPSNHLSRRGCPECGRENSGWNRTNFVNRCESKYGIGTLYVLECFNENEKFIKFGITSRTIEERYPSKDAMPYNYRILAECTGTPEMIWNIEKGLRREMKLSHYTPLIEFGGSATECFVRVE